MYVPAMDALSVHGHLMAMIYPMQVNLLFPIKQNQQQWYGRHGTDYYILASATALRAP